MNQYSHKAKQIFGDSFSQANMNDLMSPDFNQYYDLFEKMKTSFNKIRKELKSYFHTIDEFGIEAVNLDKLLASVLVTESEKYQYYCLFRSILHKVGIIQSTVAMQITDYEIDLDENFRQKVIQIVEADLDKVEKAKKKLLNAKSLVDACRLKLKNSQTQSFTSQKKRILEKDLEEAVTVFENCQDLFANETYKLLAREKEFSKLLVSFIEKQKNYHQYAYEVLKGALPKLNELLESTQSQPVFGFPIEQHEKVFEHIISFVIMHCAAYIEKYGLESEGIFRISGPISLVTRLKSEFDAGVANLEHDKPSIDVVASCLKLYLRELPEPLLTYTLKEKFILATKTDPKERLQAISNLVHQLPTPNYANLQFLMMLLTKIATKNEKNKMNSVNIGVVIGPCLLWSHDPKYLKYSSTKSTNDLR